MQTETMIFNTKADAKRVNRKLRHGSILSAIKGREVEAYVPASMTGDQVRELMRRLVY